MARLRKNVIIRLHGSWWTKVAWGKCLPGPKGCLLSHIPISQLAAPIFTPSLPLFTLLSPTAYSIRGCIEIFCSYKPYKKIFG